MNEFINPECLQPQALSLQDAVDLVDDELSRHFDDCSPVALSYETYKAQAIRALDPGAGDVRDWLTNNFPKNPEGFADEQQRLYLADALVLLLRAQRAIKQGAPEQAWYFLSLCKHSLGMADGDYTATRPKNVTMKRASSAGRGKQAPVNKAKLRVIYLLKEERPADGWKTHVQARERIGPKLRDYLAGEAITAISDVDAELLTWLENDEIVKVAYREAAAPQKRP